MAVDANILVFERLKEEIKSGKKLNAAIELGFKRAFPAIFDANACTILTSIVLLNLGTGPVKGFATTLIIGVAISLFTAVTVTRSLLIFFVGSGIGDHESWYAVNRNWFGKKFDPYQCRAAGCRSKGEEVVWYIAGDCPCQHSVLLHGRIQAERRVPRWLRGRLYA